MRRRFFVDEVRLGQAEIEGEEAKHLTRVLRVEPGQRYEISDNLNVYLAEVETARREHVVFRTLEKLPIEPPSVHITLCAALIKFDHFEWMIEKATELGVGSIMPVLATRTEHGLEKAAVKRMERWRRIAVEASQQSRRAHLPEIQEMRTFEEAVRLDATHKFVLDENPGGSAFHRALPAQRNLDDQLAVLIGPEGGWTDDERSEFTSWTRVSMGPLILRAETAALAALAVLRSAW